MHNVRKAARRQVAKARIFEGFARVKTGELRVLVNVVSVSVVLLVHHTFMFAKFKAKQSNEEKSPVIDPLCLPGIAMKELMLAGKSKALELKTIEEIKGNKNGEFVGGKLGLIKGEDIHLMNGIDRAGHDGKVDEETLETLVVRLLHKSNQNAIVKNTIALLAFTVLNVSPVFIIGIDTCKSISVCLFVEKFSQHVLDGRFLVLGRFLEENSRHTGVRRHFEGVGFDLFISSRRQDLVFVNPEKL